MISIKLYCFTWNICANVLNEKASIRSRGLFGDAWERPNDGLVSVIVTSHVKRCNTFVGCYG
jgi:hypothetical protein